MNTLTKQQQKLYDRLVRDGMMVDVAITELWTALFEKPVPNDSSYMHMQVGSYISRTNKRLKEDGAVAMIAPGYVKRTYRLVRRDS